MGSLLRLAPLWAACVLMLAFGAASAPAATIIPNTVTDVTAVDGQCSMREAVGNANANSAVNPDCAAGTATLDTIPLGSSTFELTLAPNGANDDNAGGDLDIDTDGGDITFSGTGILTSIIAGDFFTTNTRDRVMDVRGGG